MTKFRICAERRSTTVKRIAASDAAGGTLDSLLQRVDRKVSKYVPIAPVNAAPDCAVINQSTGFEPPSNAISSACSGRNSYSDESRISQTRGRQPTIWSKFSQKLHENDRWRPRLGPPLSYGSGGRNPKMTVAGRKGKNGTDFIGSSFLEVKPPKMRSNVHNFSKRVKENNSLKVPPPVNKKPKRSPGIPLGAGNPLGVYTAARKKSQGFSNIIGKSKKSKFRRDDIGVDPVAKKARLELIPNNDLRNIFYIRSEALNSINTGFEKLGVIGVLPDTSILVSINSTLSPLRRRLLPTLKTYQAKTGKLLYTSFDNSKVPDDMAVVTVNGMQHLALSYREAKAIEFYELRILYSTLQDPDDARLDSCSLAPLRSMVYRNSVAPDSPRRLCTCPSSPRTLVYVDCRPNKQVAKWLDCSYFPPTITKETIIKIPNDFVQEMCCVVHGDKHLLVTTHNYGGVQAYLTGTDKLEWCVRGRQPGMDKIMSAVSITANGSGQLLVCDVNNKCIQMLSTDGVFLATVLRSEEQILGIPRRIRWCEKTRSLVVAHEKKSLCSVSIFQC